jgi:hypothetical protein
MWLAVAWWAAVTWRKKNRRLPHLGEAWVLFQTLPGTHCVAMDKLFHLSGVTITVAPSLGCEATWLVPSPLHGRGWEGLYREPSMASLCCHGTFFLFPGVREGTQGLMHTSKYSTTELHPQHSHGAL